MAVAIYPALITGDITGGFKALLVDFPGVQAEAADIPVLLKLARERLHRLLAELDREGREWPAATAVEALAERQAAERAALMLIDVQVEETPVRVNISIGERLLRRLDGAAEAQNMTRSGYIAAAVRQRLGDPEMDERPSGAGGQRLWEEMSELRRRLNEAIGPESAFGRTVADLDARALEGLRAFAAGRSGAGFGKGRDRGGD